MKFFRAVVVASVTLISPAVVFAEPPANIRSLIDDRDVALKSCMDGYAAANYENGYMESNSTCQSAKQLKLEIQRQGWCWRQPFNSERGQDGYVTCDLLNDITALIDIDRSKDRPDTSSLEAEWLLPISSFHKDVEKRKNIGFLNFTCNDTDGARTMLSVSDEVSGFSGLPFTSELEIGYDLKTSSPYILPTQSSRKTIIFNGENTMQILRWINDSVEGSDTMSFTARENASNRQLSVSVSNFTTQHDENGPVAKRWAAHMHSMCESFSRMASRR